MARSLARSLLSRTRSSVPAKSKEAADTLVQLIKAVQKRALSSEEPGTHTVSLISRSCTPSWGALFRAARAFGLLKSQMIHLAGRCNRSRAGWAVGKTTTRRIGRFLSRSACGLYCHTSGGRGCAPYLGDAGCTMPLWRLIASRFGDLMPHQITLCSTMSFLFSLFSLSLLPLRMALPLSFSERANRNSSSTASTARTTTRSTLSFSVSFLLPQARWENKGASAVVGTVGSDQLPMTGERGGAFRHAMIYCSPGAHLSAVVREQHCTRNHTFAAQACSRSRSGLCKCSC